MKDKTISILGCGWLGKPLGEHFIKSGYNVKGSTKKKHKTEGLLKSGMEVFTIDIDNIESIDRQFLKSRYLLVSVISKSICGFKNLIQEITKSTIKNVIFISSTSVYKKANNIIAEDNTTNLNTSPLLQIEKMFLQNSAFKTTVLRFAGLFGYERKPGNFFKPGKILSDPDAYLNLIHRDDCIGIIEEIIKQDVWNEIFNCCSDSHPTKREFYTKAAKYIGNDPPEFSETEKSGYKIISNDKLKKYLKFNFKHNDFMNLDSMP